MSLQKNRNSNERGKRASAKGAGALLYLAY